MSPNISFRFNLLELLTTHPDYTELSIQRRQHYNYLEFSFPQREKAF